MNQTERLLKAYRDAKEKLEQTVVNADLKKPVAMIRSEVLDEVEKITDELEAQARNWADNALEEEYKAGSERVVLQTRHSSLILKKTGFGQIHAEAITALSEDAYLDFANGLNGVTRAGRAFVSEIVKLKINQRILTGAISGEGVQKIKKQIKELIAEQGFTALIDRGNKRWTLDRYAEMLTRTHLLKANNQGCKNRLLENKVDLVKISKHEGACEICQPYEDKIFSLTGEHKKYRQAPDLPLHPNCRHSYLPWVE